MSIFKSDTFDYETFECLKYTINDYKKMLLIEKRKLAAHSPLFKWGASNMEIASWVRSIANFWLKLAINLNCSVGIDQEELSKLI